MPAPRHAHQLGPVGAGWDARAAWRQGRSGASRTRRPRGPSRTRRTTGPQGAPGTTGPQGPGNNRPARRHRAPRRHRALKAPPERATRTSRKSPGPTSTGQPSLPAGSYAEGPDRHSLGRKLSPQRCVHAERRRRQQHGPELRRGPARRERDGGEPDGPVAPQRRERQDCWLSSSQQVESLAITAVLTGTLHTQ